jgi:hypothetical protein
LLEAIMSAFELTVLHDFGAYAKGAGIWAEDEIKAILGGENALRVNKVPAGTHSAVAKAAEAEAEALAKAAEIKAEEAAAALAAKVAAEAQVKADADAAHAKAEADGGEVATHADGAQA